MNAMILDDTIRTELLDNTDARGLLFCEAQTATLACDVARRTYSLADRDLWQATGIEPDDQDDPGVLAAYLAWNRADLAADLAWAAFLAAPR